MYCIDSKCATMLLHYEFRETYFPSDICFDPCLQLLICRHIGGATTLDVECWTFLKKCSSESKQASVWHGEKVMVTGNTHSSPTCHGFAPQVWPVLQYQLRKIGRALLAT